MCAADVEPLEQEEVIANEVLAAAVAETGPRAGARHGVQRRPVDVGPTAVRVSYGYPLEAEPAAQLGERSDYLLAVLLLRAPGEAPMCMRMRTDHPSERTK